MATLARPQANARRATAWLLWLALALAAAHSLATWHVYSHALSPADQRSSEKHHATGVCGLCIAVTSIGGAAPGPATDARQAVSSPAPRALPMVGLLHAMAQQPYTIRAPPIAAS